MHGQCQLGTDQFALTSLAFLGGTKNYKATERERQMTKVRCPNCKEFPIWQRPRLAAEGRECGVCGYIRPFHTRMSKKRAKMEALLQKLLAERAA